MRLQRGDAPLARQLAVACALLLPLAAWWLRRYPEAASALLPPCLLKTTLGLPCPTCGGTRAVTALAEGRLADAFAASPLATVAALLLALWAVTGVALTLVPRWRRRVEASPGEGRRLVIVLLAVIAAGWAWQLAS